MFNLNDVPPELQESAKLLAQQVKEKQDKCPHDFQKIMGVNPGYSPRVDDRLRGQYQTIVELHCPLCNLRKKFSEIPWKVCHQCGGQMESNGTTHYGGDRVNLHKCVECGHEYDTT